MKKKGKKNPRDLSSIFDLSRTCSFVKSHTKGATQINNIIIYVYLELMSRGLLIYITKNGVTMADSNYERVEIFSRGNFTNKAILLARKHRTICLLLSCVYTSQYRMAYDIKWIIPKLRNPTRLWNFASSLTFAAVGIFSKIFISKYFFFNYL